MREKRKGFAASSHRFDKKKDFERFFDSTPGPGSYNLMQKLANKREQSSNFGSENDGSRIESTDVSGFAFTNDNSTEDTSFMLKRSIFIPKDNGTFPKESRSPKPSEISPGPGHYEQTMFELESQRKKIAVPTFKDKRPALKLPFSLSNPLNYVNSYTVNVYYKPGHPGIGTYNVDIPNKISMNPTFNSGVQRKLPFEEVDRNDAQIQYDTKGTFNKRLVGLNNSSGQCQPTRRKLVHLNLFGPNERLKDSTLLSKLSPQTVKVNEFDKKLDITTEDSYISFRNALYGADKPINYNPRDNLMGDLNLDRFGNPIEIKSRKHEVPGPGSYNAEDVIINKPSTNKQGIFNREERIYNYNMKELPKNPGPAYYDPSIMEKKTSFHYDRID